MFRRRWINGLAIVIFLCFSGSKVCTSNLVKDRKGLLSLRILDTGFVEEVKVGEETCLKSLGWRGVPGPLMQGEKTEHIAKGEREITYTGRFVDNEGTPIATSKTIVNIGEGELNLTFLLRCEEDFEGPIQLQSYFPAFPGRSSWYYTKAFHHPGRGGIGFFSYPKEPQETSTHLFSSWFKWYPKWFLWIPNNDKGIRVDWRKIRIDKKAYVLGKQKADNRFLLLWGRHKPHKGNWYRMELSLKPSTREEIQKEIFSQGNSMISVKPSIVNQMLSLRIENVAHLNRLIDLGFKVRDYLGKPLCSGKEKVPISASSYEVKEVAIPSARNGLCYLSLNIHDEKNKVSEIIEIPRVRADVYGKRDIISLKGEWEFLRTRKITYPPEGTWKRVSIPAYTSLGHGWYKREFTLPSSMKNKIIKLKFASVQYKADIYINGKYVDSHLGGFVPFRIDITDFVKTGENELLVGVTDWETAARKDEVISFATGGKDKTGIRGEVFLLCLPKVHVKDVFIKTSVRNNDLTLEITLENEDSTSHNIEIGNQVYDKEGFKKSIRPKRLIVEPGEEKRIVITEKWRNPKLWSLDSPHLYNLNTVLKERDMVVDSLNNRFGFREFWVEGSKFIFNGVPIRLWSSSTWYEFLEPNEVGYKLAKRTKEAGNRILRLHGGGWQLSDSMDVADELGLPIIRESIFCYYPRKKGDVSEEYWDNYEKHLKERIREERNHPSILIWSLENEILIVGAPPSTKDRLAKLGGFVRRIDSTRPIVYEGDKDPGGVADIYNIHSPFPIARGYAKYFPEDAYWVGRAMKGENVSLHCYSAKALAKNKKPLFIGEMWCREKYNDAAALFFGDRGYEFSYQEVGRRIFKEWLPMLFEAFRYDGVAGWSPMSILNWEDPEYCKTLTRTLGIFFRDYSRRLFSGEKVTLSPYIFSDLIEKGEANLTFEWQVRLKQNVLRRGKENLLLAPTEIKACPLSFNLPRVKERARLTLSLSLYYKGRKVFSEDRQYSVLPRLTSLRLPSTAIGLFDNKNGKTKEILDRLGIDYKRVKDPSSASFPRPKVLIIGEGLLSKRNLATLDLRALSKFVSKGGRVVFLKQKVSPDLPIDSSITFRHSTICFPRAPAHPILNGIEKEDLKFWRGENHFVSKHNFLKPKKGNFRIIIDCGGEPDGLNWSPLLEVPYGKGFYILCQLDLVNKFDTEPVASVLFKNILSYTSFSPPPKWKKTLLLADGPLRDVLSSLNLNYQDIKTGLSGTKLHSSSVIIIGGSQNIWDEVAKNKLRLETFVKEGGTLWVHNLTPETVEIIESISGRELRLEPRGREPLLISSRDKVISSLSNHDFYWPDENLLDYALKVEGVKELTSPSAIIRIPLGRGSLLIDQIYWDKTRAYKKKGSRIACILLTNLGAFLKPTSPSLTGDFRFKDYFQVDLSNYANSGMRDEMKKERGWFEGGWSEATKWDLSALPIGLKIMDNSVPFKIIDPESNKGKMTLALYGNLRPHLPKKIEQIKVKRKSKRLYFLHFLDFAYRGLPQSLGVVCKYVAYYQGGRKIEIPVDVPDRIDYWRNPPESLKKAEVAWRGSHPTISEGIGIYSMEWINPSPEEIISSIDFVSEEKYPVPVLIAITGKIN